MKNNNFTISIDGTTFLLLLTLILVLIKGFGCIELSWTLVFVPLYIICGAMFIYSLVSVCFFIYFYYKTKFKK